MSPRPYVIGITGGSASGKTTVANRLAELLADFSLAILHQDRYFRDFSHLPPEEYERVRTANHPDALLWPAFLESFERLLDGQPVVEPATGSRLAARGAPTVTVEPGEILIVEGLFALWEDSLRARLDLKLFLDVDDDERVLRRLTRDLIERGGTVPHVVSWYRRDVKPNYPKYTGDSRRYADVVIPNNQPCDTAVQLVAAGVRGLLRARTPV